MTYQCTEEQFLKDVAEHQMTVVRDDGLYRHVRFKAPGTMMEHFDLITWPGYLCYTGDMGTFVFTRLRDMFEFFRTDREHFTRRPGREHLAINPGYWSEKLEATDRCGGHESFSEERFRRAVIGDLVAWLRGHRDETTKGERRELWEAVMSEVIEADSDRGGHRKQCAAHDFHHQIRHDLSFYFQDFSEHSVDDYSCRFMWCCYALAWGVEKYDESKQLERCKAEAA